MRIHQQRVLKKIYQRYDVDCMANIVLAYIRPTFFILFFVVVVVVAVVIFFFFFFFSRFHSFFVCDFFLSFVFEYGNVCACRDYRRFYTVVISSRIIWQPYLLLFTFLFQFFQCSVEIPFESYACNTRLVVSDLMLYACTLCVLKNNHIHLIRSG